MNLEKFEELKEYIKKQPDVCMNKYISKEACGTIGCIAGNACMMEGNMIEPWTGYHEEAEKILGIPSHRDSTNLFHLHYWPPDFIGRWKNEKENRKQVMIDRINYFMENNE